MGEDKQGAADPPPKLNPEGTQLGSKSHSVKAQPQIQYPNTGTYTQSTVERRSL